MGTGAGDRGMLCQDIATSSLYLQMDGLSFIIDPGPGTLVNAARFGIHLEHLDGIVLSHPHPDHSADVNCLVDALAGKNSFLLANSLCLDGNESYYPVIQKYQQSVPALVKGLVYGESVQIGTITFSAIENPHLDCGMGFLIQGSRTVGYVGDGTLEGVAKYYSDVDVMILNLLYPRSFPGVPHVHASFECAVDFLRATVPGKAYIQHYSMQMLEAGPEQQAELLTQASGVSVKAAHDGYEVQF